MADDVKNNFVPVGEVSKHKELSAGTVIDIPGLPNRKVPQGKKIVSFVVSWTGLLVDE